MRISDAGEQPALNNVEKNVNQQEDNRMEPSLIIGIVVGLAALLTGYTLEGGKLVSLMLFSPAHRNRRHHRRNGCVVFPEGYSSVI